MKASRLDIKYRPRYRQTIPATIKMGPTITAAGPDAIVTPTPTPTRTIPLMAVAVSRSRAW